MDLKMLVGRIPIDSVWACILYNLIKIEIDIIRYKFNI